MARRRNTPNFALENACPNCYSTDKTPQQSGSDAIDGEREGTSETGDTSLTMKSGSETPQEIQSSKEKGKRGLACGDRGISSVTCALQLLRHVRPETTATGTAKQTVSKCPLHYTAAIIEALSDQHSPIQVPHRNDPPTEVLMAAESRNPTDIAHSVQGDTKACDSSNQEQWKLRFSS
ncbi:hypothetical protein R1flu_006550 [Riccia fluitans]|uniref:Uncharacterized protein n=1 Tax=Riccia fluitans TaxID=41844 RepID=A0ABD1YWC4_9MARC